MCTSPFPLFPGPVLLGPDLVYFPQLREPLSWPGLASLLPARGGEDSPLSLGYCPQWQHSHLLPVLKGGPWACTAREGGEGSHLGVSVSHCCHINQGPFISRKQLHPAAPTSPDGGSLPLPSLPLLPPFPSPQSLSPFPGCRGQAGARQGHTQFPFPAAPPWGDTHLLPFLHPIYPSPRDLAGVGAGGVVRRGVHRRLAAVGLRAPGQMLSLDLGYDTSTE